MCMFQLNFSKIKKIKMRKITLGRTGQSVSAISLGTWSYGGQNKNGSVPVGWGGQTGKDSRAALLKAFESEINHWDTADVYGDGRSEKIIGSMWGSIPREDIFLATKVGWDKGPHEYWYHPDHMRKNMHRSLENLQDDCVDLMYLHHCNFGGEGEYFDDAIEVVRRFQEEGKTRFIGLSDWNLTKIMRFIEQADPDVVQPYRNVWEDSYESSGLKQWIEDRNLGVCFFSPLMHGLLSGKYSEPPEFEDGDFRKNIDSFRDQNIIDRLKENANQLREKFSDHPNPVMRGVIDSLLFDSPSGCVLLGQRNTTQVEVAATLGRMLPENDANWVKSIYVH